MRTTLKIDDVLLARAKSLTGHDDVAALVHEALTALVERESARRLALLGGTEPDLRLPRRDEHEIPPANASE
jgi:Arc/MetJ family transcription regulator